MNNSTGEYRKQILPILTICLSMIAFLLPLEKQVNAQETIPAYSQGGNIIPARNTGIELFETEVNINVLPVESTTPMVSQASALCDLEVDARWQLKNPGKFSETVEIWLPLSSVFQSTENQIEMEMPMVFMDDVETTAEWLTAVFPPGIIQEEAGGAEFSQKGWAAFKIKIPAESSVKVRTYYKTKVNGLRPIAEFDWQFGLGNPWTGKIGKTTLTIQFPYEVNDINFIDYNGESILNQASHGNQAQFSSWDVEPKQNENWKFSFLLPVTWQEVLAARHEMENNPGDGAAWAHLGNAYSSAALLNDGTLRRDDGGTRLVLMADEAYRQAIALMPQDSEVRLNLAELLMSTYTWSPWESDPMTDPLLLRINNEIETVRQIDPENERANALSQRLTAYYIPRGAAIDPSAVVQIPTSTLMPTAFPTSTPVVCATALPCDCPEAPKTDLRMQYLIPVGGLIFLASLLFLAFKFRK